MPFSPRASKEYRARSSGTCVTAIIEGEPDHRDVYFNQDEHASGKLITPCVSRCKGKRLVRRYGH
jgi:hypothetical protein